MKIGCCTMDYLHWGNIKEIGYDYIEGNFQQINFMSDEDYQKLKQAQTDSGLRVEVCNGFFPGNFVLYALGENEGIDSDAFKAIEQRLRDYCRHGFERVAELGCEIVVIGSGAARRCPDISKKAEAHAQFCRVLTVIADIAPEYGIKVTVEPLNQRETNTVNTLAQSLDILDELKHPNLFAMNDFYHSRLENEPLSSLDRAGDRLIHLHVCRANRVNCTMDDRDDLLPFIQHVIDIGYDGRISLESAFKTDPITGLRQSIGIMKLFKELKK